MAGRNKAAALPHAQFGRTDHGRAWIHVGAVDETATGHAFAGTVREAQAAAQAINALPAARDALLAVIATCRSDETDVELPSVVMEQVREALAAMGVRSC